MNEGANSESQFYGCEGQNCNNWQWKGRNPRVDEALVIKNKNLEVKIKVSTNPKISGKE